MMWPLMNLAISAVRRKRLPVVEMESAHVLSHRLPNAPQWNRFVRNHADLVFSGPQLAHAVIKAEFLNRVNPLLPGLGFLLQSQLYIDWAHPNLALRSGGSTLLTDFAQTSLTGRIGQGLSLLFAQSRGYVFSGHLREILHSLGIPTVDPSGNPLRIADFLCSGHGVQCILESKASCSQKQNCPKKLKGLLKPALEEQVNHWLPQFGPQTKGFVVASYLREHSNSAWDPSVLAFVDPEGGDEGDRINIPEEVIRRENYAAWLMALGLVDAAEGLRNPRSARTPQPLRFIVTVINDRRIAFPFLDPWPLFLLPDDLFGTGPVGLGIELDALRAVSAAAQGENGPLLAYEPLEGRDITTVGEYRSSTFPDGTFLGNTNELRELGVVEFPL